MSTEVNKSQAEKLRKQILSVSNSNLSDDEFYERLKDDHYAMGVFQRLSGMGEKPLGAKDELSFLDSLKKQDNTVPPATPAEDKSLTAPAPKRTKESISPLMPEQKTERPDWNKMYSFTQDAEPVVTTPAVSAEDMPTNLVEKRAEIPQQTPEKKLQGEIEQLGVQKVEDPLLADNLINDTKKKLEQWHLANDSFIREYEDKRSKTVQGMQEDQYLYTENFNPFKYLFNKDAKESEKYLNENSTRYQELIRQRDALNNTLYAAESMKQYADYDRSKAVGEDLSAMVDKGELTEDDMDALRGVSDEQEKEQVLSEMYRSGRISQDTMKKIQNLGDTSNKNGLLYGLFKTGHIEDFVFMGLTEISRNMDVLDVIKRKNNGIAISSDEETLLNVYGKLLELEGKERDFWFNAGTGMQQSLQFVLQTALTGGVGTAASAGKGVAQTMMKTLATNAVRQAILTPLTPSMYEDYTRRLIGLEYSNDEVSGSDKAKELWKSYAGTFSERFSETFGGIVGDYNLFSKLVDNKFTRKLLGESFETMSKISNNAAYKTTADALRYAGVTDIPGEIASEFSGAIMNSILTMNGEELAQTFTLNFAGQVALQSVLMGGMGSVASYGIGSGYAAIESRKVRKQYEQSMTNLESAHFDNPSIEPLRKQLMEALAKKEVVDKDGKVENSNVTKILESIRDDYSSQKDHSPNDVQAMRAVDNAVRSGVFRYGQEQAVMAIVEDHIGEYLNEDGNVYEVTDSQGTEYFMLDKTDDVVILINRATGEKVVKPNSDFGTGSVKRTSGSDFALNTFLLNIDKWNKEQPAAEAEIDSFIPADKVEMNGVVFDVAGYDPDTNKYTIIDEQGRQTEVNADDEDIAPIYSNAVQEQQNAEEQAPEGTPQEAQPEAQPEEVAPQGETAEQEIIAAEQAEAAEQVPGGEVAQMDAAEATQEYVAPRDNEGEVVWEEVPADKIKKTLDEEIGPDDAVDYIDMRIKNAKKKLADQKKRKAPEKASEFKAFRSATRALEAEVKYWSNAKAEYTRPIEVEAEVVEQPIEKVYQNKADNSLPEGVKPYTPSQEIVDRYNNAPKAYGAEDTYTDADGNTYKGRWVVIEADAVTPSHDPNTLQTSEGFPLTDKGRNVNDNDYSTKRGVVETMASDYDSRALDEPVLVSNGVVVSGNNRTIGRQLAAQKGTDTKYTEALPKKAEMRGVSAEELGKFNNPSLVFELSEPIEYTTENFARFNRARSKTKSPVDMAIAIGKQDTSRLVGQILSTIGEVEKLSELYQNQNAVAAIMKQIVESGIINQNEMPQFYTQEYGITDSGKDFIETLLVGSVINEDQIRILNSEGMKQYREKIVSAMLPIANNMKYEDNIGKHLNTAIKYLKEARDTKTDLRGILLDVPMFDAKEYEDLSIFTALMLQRKPTEFREFINNLNQRLELGTDNLFGESNNAQSVLEDYKQQNKLTDNERETIRLAEQARESATQGVSGSVQTDGTDTDTRGEGDNGDSIPETKESWDVEDLEDEEDVVFTVVGDTFDDYQNRLDEIDRDRKKAIAYAQSKGKKPIIGPAFDNRKVDLYTEMYNELSSSSDVFSVVTINTISDVLKKDGYSEGEIKRIINRAYYRKNGSVGRGLFSGGKYYFFADNIPSIEQARRTFVHERQHRLTKENPQYISEIIKVISREDLESIVRKISGSKAYDGSSQEYLADEFISRAIELVYTTDAYSSILENYGVSKEVINIIKNIDNEQRQGDSLFKSRRGSSRNENGVRDDQGIGGQNRRNPQSQSEKVGTQRVGPNGRGGEGTWDISGGEVGRTPEQKQALFEKAKEVFGTTTNFKVAGYMLPDGSLLDFSGKWEGGPGDERYTDHRAIASGLSDASDIDSNFDTNMYDFINQGAIRLMPESGGIYVSQPLTDAQEETLARYISKYNGEVILDITDKDGNIISYIEYNRRTSANRVLDDINNYFEKGVIPTQPEIRYRIPSTPAEARQRAENIIKDAIDPMARELGVEVNYVTNENISDVEPGARKKRQSKGWYQDGKVYINLSTQETIDDARETYLHEVVGHYGLRGLLKDQFEPVMQKVFASLTPTQQQSLLEIFADEVEAAEEFLSSMAENDIEPSLVTKILAIIRDALRSIGINVDNYTNGDLEYLLWRSKNSLKENAGAVETAKWEAKDAEVRYRMVNRPAGYTTNKMAMTNKDKILHAIQDRMRPVKKIMNEIIARKGVLDETTDPYSQEFLATSRAAAEIDKFKEEQYTPLAEAIAEAMKVFTSQMNMTSEEARKTVDDYLYARHAPERNKQICVNEIYDTTLQSIAPKNAHLVDDAFKAEIRRMCAEVYDNQFKGGKNMISPNGLTSEQEKVAISLARVMQKKALEISKETALDNATGQTVVIGNNRSGMTDQEAESIMRNVYNNATKAALDKVSEKVKGCTDFTLDKWLEYGLISKDDYNSYKAQYEYYIPLRGWDERGEDIDYMSIPTKQFNQASELISRNIKAKGRSSRASDPLAHIASLAQSACINGNKNLIRLHAFRMVEKNESKIADIAYIEKTFEIYDDQGNIIGYTKRAPSKKMFDQGRVKVIKDKDYKWHKTESELAAHKVPVMIDGVAHTIYFKGEIGALAATAINGTDRDTRNIVTQTMSAGTRFISSNLTAKNIYFLAKNLARDFGFGNFSYFIENGLYQTLKMNRNFITSMRTVSADARGKDMSTYIDGALYQEFKLNGGQTGFIQLDSLNKLSKQMDEMIANASANRGVISQGAYNTKKFIVDSFEILGEISENSMRFAVYKAERERGMSPRQAAIAAKEVSVNFNRQGTKTKGFSAVYAFFNPAVQGAYSYAKFIQKNPIRFVEVAGAVTAIKFGLGMICELLSGGDDLPEGESAYDRLSDYVKATNFVIPLGAFSEDGEDKFLCIPLPSSLRGTTYIADVAVDMVFGRKDFGQAMKDYAMFNVGEFIPFDFDAIDLTGDNPMGTMIQAASPTILRPVVETVINRDFMGNPISKEPFVKSQDYLPQHKLAFNSTSPILVGTSKLLNEIGGGDEKRSAKYQISENGQIEETGWSILDINPAKMEHLFKGYFGGMFEPWMDVWDTMRSATSKDIEIATDAMPLMNQFIKGPSNKPGYKKFYELRDEAQNIKDIGNLYKEDYMNQNYIPLNSNSFNIEIETIYDIYSNLVSNYNETLMMMESNSGAIGTDKESIKEIEKQRDALILEAAVKYREICDRRDKENKNN